MHPTYLVKLNRDGGIQPSSISQTLSYAGNGKCRETCGAVLLAPRLTELHLRFFPKALMFRLRLIWLGRRGLLVFASLSFICLGWIAFLQFGYCKISPEGCQWPFEWWHTINEEEQAAWTAAVGTLIALAIAILVPLRIHQLEKMAQANQRDNAQRVVMASLKPYLQAALSAASTSVELTNLAALGMPTSISPVPHAERISAAVEMLALTGSWENEKVVQFAAAASFFNAELSRVSTQLPIGAIEQELRWRALLDARQMLQRAAREALLALEGFVEVETE